MSNSPMEAGSEYCRTTASRGEAGDQRGSHRDGQRGGSGGTGLVATLARPGGNVTGTTVGAVETAGKLVELIRDMLPSAQRFAVLANETDPFTKPYLAELNRVARSIGMEMEPVMVLPVTPLDAGFQRMTTSAQKPSLSRAACAQDAVELATKHRLPSFSPSSLVPQIGGLIAYSADIPALLQEVAV